MFCGIPCSEHSQFPRENIGEILFLRQAVGEQENEKTNEDTCPVVKCLSEADRGRFVVSMGSSTSSTWGMNLSSLSSREDKKNRFIPQYIEFG